MAWLSRKMAWLDRGLPLRISQYEMSKVHFPHFSSVLHRANIDLFNKSQKAGRPLQTSMNELILGYQNHWLRTSET